MQYTLKKSKIYAYNIMLKIKYHPYPFIFNFSNFKLLTCKLIYF